MHDRAAAELPWPSPIPRRIHDAGKAGVRLKGRASRVTGDGGGRFERNELWGNSDCGVRVCEEAADSLLFDNLVRDHAGNGIYFESEAFDRFMTTDIVFERNAGGAYGGPGWDNAICMETDEATWPAAAAWWADQHQAALAERTAGADPPGWVFPPDTYDVIVSPGEDVQAAVDRCPSGGSVLLMPGTHHGTLTLKGENGGTYSEKSIRVFGRGLATLRYSGRHRNDTVIFSNTFGHVVFDGLIVHQDSGLGGACLRLYRGGTATVQACDLSSRESECMESGGGNELSMTGCRYDVRLFIGL